MSLSSIRSQIKTILGNVTNIGNVYDYKRYSNDWGTYKDLFVKNTHVNEWEIQRNSFSTIAHGGTGSVKDTTHELVIRGFYSFKDIPSSEKEFDTIIDAITDKFVKNPTLDGTSKILHIPITGEITFGNLGQVLCHIIEIRLLVEERTLL